MLSGDLEIQLRAADVEHLLRGLLDDEFPVFVSDDASVFDVSSLPAEEIVDRLARAFGVAVSSDDLRLPIWKLVDRLRSPRQ